MALQAVRTPKIQSLRTTGKTLIDHYVDTVVLQTTTTTTTTTTIKQVTQYLIVDGYFMKKEFIKPEVAAGLHVITTMRPDANLCYMYKGPHSAGRGRLKLYDSKIACKNIDKRNSESSP
ncbi:hypothetical protein [Chryseobacterium sp. 'Rf worker isolate 10']|uniref:hypothetical protein n=1 Tax=Chryseobacterium sp. 'Rf worker isolate 10' TaxID=2887348 RepID=UPI003D6E519C